MRTPRLPLLATVAAVCASALLLVGCGASEKNDYVEKNNEIQARAQKAVSGLNTSAQDPAAAAKDMARTKAALDDAAKDLDALTPPDDWKDEHEDLVEAIEGMSEQVDAMSAAIKAKDVTAINESITELTKLQAQSSKAIDAMNADR